MIMSIDDFDFAVTVADKIGNVTLKKEELLWLINQIKTLQAERDAALKDLKKQVAIKGGLCWTCKKDVTCISEDKPCEWEWRGIQDAD